MRSIVYVLPLYLLVMAGCRTPGYQVEMARDRMRILPAPDAVQRPAAPVAQQEQRLQQAVLNLAMLGEQLVRLEKESASLKIPTDARKRGYFTSDETELIESLLFRYLACRESLWEMIATYGDPNKHFAGAEYQTKSLTIGFNAAVLLSQYSSSLVAAFVDEPAMIRKLNERYIRYGIPAGTYDMLFDAVTSRDNIGALQDARQYFTAEAEDRASTLSRIRLSEPVYGQLVETAMQRFDLVDKNIHFILKKRSILLPGVANRVRQHTLLKQARETQKQISDNLYVAKGLLFNSISDIKRPMTPPVDFTPDQIGQIKQLLEPGDLLLTFTAGYMSNVFLPGKFKHGITYVGTPDARRAAGMAADLVNDLPGHRRRKLALDLATGKLASGYDADVIEAVAEGVIFNSLDYLLKHHVNRLVVLRPRAVREARNMALVNTFLMLGGRYDFNFDFSDASHICCTEVIYRSWHKRGGIHFPLVRRAMVQTLSADDIIEYHLSRAEQPVFDVVLLAEEKSRSKAKQGVLHIGQDAAARLESLMTGKGGWFPFFRGADAGVTPGWQHTGRSI